MTRRELFQWTQAALAVPAFGQAPVDWREISNGSVIPDEGYADQPYVVHTADGKWLCVLTTGKGVEGEGGQHVIATISADRGKTWSQPIDVEPASGPEASWAVPLVTPSGRIYVFYTYNRDNIRVVPNVSSPSIAKRVDTLGIWAFKYSDDHGRTWSRDRFEIPLRPWDADESNNFEGRQRFFWSVAKPLIDRGTVFIGFARISKWGLPGVLVRSRGFAVSSSNILSEPDPRKIRWTMLPANPEGLRAPKGPIAEETNITALSDGMLFALYRTIDGYLCHAYSKDRGLTWTDPAYATYTPNGTRRLKHPRAFAFARRFSNGRYLLWFHNQGGEAVHARPRWDYYQDRNPGWVCAGIEQGGRIAWSEPEILLYDSTDPKIRISYPDFIEDRGRIFITETQKSVARVHEIDSKFLTKLWGFQATGTPAVERSGLALEKRGPGSFAMPSIGPRGFSLDFSFRLAELTPDQILIEARDATGKGFAVLTGERFNLKLMLNDGVHESVAESDYGTHEGTLRTDRIQQCAITVDAGPRIVSFIVDGVFNDGGATRQFGWTRYEKELSLADLNGDLQGNSRVPLLRVYERPLMTCEAVANWRAATSANRVTDRHPA